VHGDFSFRLSGRSVYPFLFYGVVQGHLVHVIYMRRVRLRVILFVMALFMRFVFRIQYLLNVMKEHDVLFLLSKGKALTLNISVLKCTA